MKSKKSETPVGKLSFSKTSILIFTAALISILAGYILMSAGDITLSPALLVLGYVILIPVAILKK
ncbi:MAG: hypothetical protein PHW02_07845 [bacterium]|nr:hypothetical protein [bacterium]